MASPTDTRGARRVRSLLCLLAAAIVSVAGATAWADVEAGITAARAGNFTMAQAEFLREANLGNPQAQVLLAELYHKGRGTGQSYAEAARWYHEAAARGHPVAQYMLGDYFRRGLGVDQDTTRALEWYRRAADQQLSPSQYAVAIHYRDGIGVDPDPGAATEWFEKAARQGLVAAQVNLGLRYWRGTAVPRDRILGYAWMRKAAGQGDINAVQTLKRFEQEMSEDDIRAGRKLALSLN